MGKFITDQILGMKWLNTLIGNLLGTLGLDVTSRIGGSIQFFLYDVIKITVLLCVLIYLISYIQSYFPPERSKKIMGRFHGIWANCIAALLGTVTPFCSCSSIPLFIGFVPIVKFLLGVSNVSVPWDTLILSVVLFVVIPLAGGMLTRYFVTRKKGAEYFESTFVKKFDGITTIGLLLTLVLIFAFQGQVILDNPLHIVLIAVPLILQTFLIFGIAYGACWLLKLPHRIAAPAGMIGASNFFELAVAVAVALFGTTSPAALATTVGVLTEVPVMLFLVKIANKTKGRFPA